MPIINPIPRVAEYEKFNLKITASPTGNEIITGVRIIEWDENKGVEVSGNNIKGDYQGAFIYKPNTLRIRKGNEYSYLTSWEEITEPSKTDVYYWKAPDYSVYYSYTVEVTYTVPPPSPDSRISEYNNSTGGVYTGTVSHEVYPNWDVYAEKLREQIRIRRLTWQEGDDILWRG